MSSDSMSQATKDLPPFPPGVRLATPSDAPRLGIVGTASFYHTDFFAYLRPKYKEYPQDVVADYREHCLQMIQDPKYVLVVSEDEYEADERDKVDETVKGIYPKDGAGEGKGKAVVGYAVFSLESDPGRIGKIQSHPSEETVNTETHNLHRDHGSGQGLKNIIERFQKFHELFKNKMELTRLTVHPAYWRRGHAHRLCRFWLDLADTDGIQACVTGGPMGKGIYVSLGFKTVLEDYLEGYDECPGGLRSWIGFRDMPE